MGWAAHYITKLQSDETVSFRPRGNSMAGKIASGQLCTVQPIGDAMVLSVGDIVLCKVGATSTFTSSRRFEATDTRSETTEAGSMAGSAATGYSASASGSRIDRAGSPRYA